MEKKHEREMLNKTKATKEIGLSKKEKQERL